MALKGRGREVCGVFFRAYFSNKESLIIIKLFNSKSNPFKKNETEKRQSRSVLFFSSRLQRNERRGVLNKKRRFLAVFVFFLRSAEK